MRHFTDVSNPDDVILRYDVIVTWRVVFIADLSVFRVCSLCIHVCNAFYIIIITRLIIIIIIISYKQQL